VALPDVYSGVPPKLPMPARGCHVGSGKMKGFEELDRIIQLSTTRTIVDPPSRFLLLRRTSRVSLPLHFIVLEERSLSSAVCKRCFETLRVARIGTAGRSRNRL
jgi:hypothetical protein